MSVCTYTSPMFTECSKDELDEKIDRIMYKFGISKKYMGAQYLRRAIEIVYFDKNAIHNVIDGLYRTVSLEYGTSAACVERNCRTYIGILWKKCDPQILTEYFSTAEGSVADKPSVREFISVIAEKLRCEYIEKCVQSCRIIEIS